MQYHSFNQIVEQFKHLNLHLNHCQSVHLFGWLSNTQVAHMNFFLL